MVYHDTLSSSKVWDIITSIQLNLVALNPTYEWLESGNFLWIPPTSE
jgi:hypothetical protein